MASARRERLLRVHASRLRREDLEDCFSQATLELMVRARAGVPFAGRGHLVNALEQRFISRVHDRRRALAGRSPIQAALASARPLGEGEGLLEVADARVELERLIMLRAELRRIWRLAAALTPDQRLVLATQVALQLPPGVFCARYGWTQEKYRKVAQRARARLRQLIALEEGVPPTDMTSVEAAGLPMSISPPPHGPARKAAGGRSHRRQHGDGHPRASGRGQENSPSGPRPPARARKGGPGGQRG